MSTDTREAPYGYCPECGAAGVTRERRPGGNDRCANGHTYPSRSAHKAIAAKADTREALAELVALKDIKDRLADGLNEVSYFQGGKYLLAEYERRKPLAWAAARAALATQPAQPSARPLTAREASVMHKALLRSSKFVEPAQPSAQGEAVAWLVEWKAHGYGPQWWGFNHTPGKNATWCSDANNAIRFARKEDAERMRLHIIAVAGLTGMHEYERSVSVTEHMWEGPCRAN